MDELDEEWIRMYNATYILDDYIQMVWNLLEHKGDKEEHGNSERTLSFTLDTEQFFGYANKAAEIIDHDSALASSFEELATMISHGAVGTINDLIQHCIDNPEIGPGPGEGLEQLTINQLVVVDQIFATVLAPMILAGIRLGQDRPEDFKSEPDARSKEMLKHFDELLQKKRNE